MMNRYISITVALLCCFTLLINTSLAQEASSFTTSDGEILSYSKVGSGPQVILLSGGPGYSVEFISAWADSLREKYEFILFHQRGTGLSSDVKLDSTTINIKTAARDIEDLRKHLGTNKVTLAGFSYGGGLALAYAAYYPNQTEKIVMLNTIGPDLTSIRGFGDNVSRNRTPWVNEILEFWNAQPDDSLSERMRTKYSQFGYFYDHRKAEYFLSNEFFTYGFSPRMSNLMWSDLSKNYDLSEDLNAYEGKSIIIRSRQDPIPAEAAFDILKAVPQTELYPIEKSGHFPFWEQPEQFYKTLEKVLSL